MVGHQLISKVVRALLISLFVFAVSFVSAVFYIVVLWLTLPPSDLAHDQSLLETFHDPFVRSIGLTGAIIFALTVLPFALLCLGENWLQQGLVCAGLVLGFIVIVTPFSPFLGAFGSPVAAILIMLLQRFAFG